VEEQITFIHEEIPDSSVTSDERIEELVERLISLFDAGKLIYVHCWGGAGRTGTVIACLIARLYGLDAEEALKLTGEYYKCRVVVRHRSPQTLEQFAQVRRMVAKWAAENAI
jgi:protein-tyrosine phosphatase